MNNTKQDIYSDRSCNILLSGKFWNAKTCPQMLCFKCLFPKSQFQSPNIKILPSFMKMATTSETAGYSHDTYLLLAFQKQQQQSSHWSREATKLKEYTYLVLKWMLEMGPWHMWQLGMHIMLQCRHKMVNLLPVIQEEHRNELLWVLI